MGTLRTNKGFVPPKKGKVSLGEYSKGRPPEKFPGINVNGERKTWDGNSKGGPTFQAPPKEGRQFKDSWRPNLEGGNPPKSGGPKGKVPN